MMATNTYRDKQFEQPLDPCGRVNDNLLGNNLIIRLEPPNRSSPNTLFALKEDESTWFMTRQEISFKPQSVTIDTLESLSRGRRFPKRNAS